MYSVYFIYIHTHAYSSCFDSRTERPLEAR